MNKKDISNITLAFATEKDIPDVCRIVQQLTPDNNHDYRDAVDKFRNYIKPSSDYYLWVAKLHEKVVGTAMMHLQHKLSYHCGTAAHLEDLVVDKEFRSMGIGKMLLNVAIDTANRIGCYKIMLTCYDKTATIWF